MNRFLAKTTLKPTTSKIVSNRTSQSFKEMIQWRKEKVRKERLERNKKLMSTLKNDINPRFQLADISAFTLPKSLSNTSSSPSSLVEWKDLGLRDDLIKGLLEGLKLKRPFPSQISGIPALLRLKTAGLFAAPTGCGKTLTYLLSLFQKLKDEEKGGSVPIEFRNTVGPRALILVPTHELVRQVYSTAKGLSHYSKLRIETIDTIFKFKPLGSPDILITTPRSFLKNQLEGEGVFKIKCGDIKRIVVDEADTLFSAEFATQIKEILALPPSKEDLKVWATSATITRHLQKCLTGLFPDTKIHMVAGLHAALPSLRQRFLTIHQPGNAKAKEALRIISDEPTSKIIIFCNKLVRAESLHKFLSENLLKESVLPALFHGNLPPIQRASIINNFSSGLIRVLVCTDLAARGLDTPDVNHVINFDFPRSIQDYLHRAGRTARAGKGGVVTSFVTGKDKKLFEYIQLAAKQRRILSDPL